MAKTHAYLVAALSLLGYASAANAQLRADELLLVVNGNSKESIRLAEHYSRLRNVPADRIVKLNLPAAEEIPFELYEKNVWQPVRQFLRDNKLEHQVRCLVTFYGTPIRVAAGPAANDELNKELAAIRVDLDASSRQCLAEVSSLETFVSTVDATFLPLSGDNVDQIARRLDHSIRTLGIRASASPAGAPVINARLTEAYERLIGKAGLIERIGRQQLANPLLDATARQQLTDNLAKANAAQTILKQANDRRFDPVERTRARDTARENFGCFGLMQLAQNHTNYLNRDESQAAVDSELALLWWDWYPRTKWMTNPLYYKVGARGAPPTLMVSRLDGPDGAVATDEMLGAIKVEREGLKGRIVIDSRGLADEPDKPGSYGDYDQKLRNFHAMVKDQTQMPVVFDDRGDVLPARSQEGVALYIGWYSVSNYVPACRFVPGAVGYHVASYEMTTLRDPKNNGWVKGLLRDGLVGTLGAVAEPYLFSFPQPDEFFPLLLTGKLTWAEVYWKTQKTVSWQISLVGDPLYRPFAVNPMFKPDDLPPGLRTAISAGPTTQP